MPAGSALVPADEGTHERKVRHGALALGHRLPVRVWTLDANPAASLFGGIERASGIEIWSVEIKATKNIFQQCFSEINRVAGGGSPILVPE